MGWPKYILIAWLVLGALLTIAHVGKKREPMTAGTAALSTVFTAGLVWLVVLA